MAITDISRAYPKNLRALRRYLQGRGVDLRQTIVVSDAVYAADRITVPGLHADDKVYSVLNLTDLVDVTGYLNDGGVQAVLTVFSVNKGIVFTATKAGLEGNKIYVKAAAAAGASLPLSVDIGPYDTLIPGTGHAGKTVILVNLATNGSSVALTDGSNSATLVEAAILAAMNVPAGGNGRIVEMVQTGSGATDWTAQAVTPLVGGADFNQGPTAAKLVTALSPYVDADVRYVARRRGADGNDITVAYAAGGSLGVVVTNTDIVVTYVIGVTTAQDVIDAVNADADASALVVASPVRYGTGSAGSADEGDTSGVVETMGATNLDGGVDPGIELSVASNAKKLLVAWVTRDEIDEN